MVPPPFPFPRRWGEVAAQEGHLWGQTWAVPSPALVALAGGWRSNAGGQNATATQDHEAYEEQQWQPGQEARGCEENEWDLGQGEGNDEIILVDAWAEKLVAAARKRSARLLLQQQEEEEGEEEARDQKIQDIQEIPEPPGPPPPLLAKAEGLLPPQDASLTQRSENPTKKKKQQAVKPKMNRTSAREKQLYKRYGLERGKRIAVNEMALDAVFAARATKHGHDGTS